MMPNETIRKINNKYGEPVFRMALSHLFEKGREAFQQVDVDKECKSILRCKGKNPIITPELQVQIVRCAHELAKPEIWDIFSYIKTDVAIDGVTVHGGKIISFRWDGTNDLILYCTVPGDTDESLIDEASQKLDEMVEAYSVKHDDDGSDFDYPTAIWNAFLSVGIRPKLTESDRTVYV